MRGLKHRENNLAQSHTVEEPEIQSVSLDPESTLPHGHENHKAK